MTATPTFTSTIKNQLELAGRKKVSYGTFVNANGATGGDINTGLNICDHIVLQYTGASVGTAPPAINETLPGADGSAITVVTDANSSGIWKAEGQ